MRKWMGTIKQSNIKILTRIPEADAEEERLFSISNNKKKTYICFCFSHNGSLPIIFTLKLTY